jgi:hypothetical protein
MVIFVLRSLSAVTLEMLLGVMESATAVSRLMLVVLAVVIVAIVRVVRTALHVHISKIACLMMIIFVPTRRKIMTVQACVLSILIV